MPKIFRRRRADAIPPMTRPRPPTFVLGYVPDASNPSASSGASYVDSGESVGGRRVFRISKLLILQGLRRVRVPSAPPFISYFQILIQSGGTLVAPGRGPAGIAEARSLIDRLGDRAGRL